MTDRVNLSPGSAAIGYHTATSIRYGAQSEGWIVSEQEAILADVDPDIVGAPLDAFEEQSAVGDTLTVGSGEAFIGGAWIARDDTTPVTLPTDAGDYTVYVGWAAASRDTVILGLSDIFGDKDPRIPIYEVTISGGEITDTTDVRQVGPMIDVPNARYEMEALTAEIPITTLAPDDVAKTPIVIPADKTLKVLRLVRTDINGNHVGLSTRLIRDDGTTRIAMNDIFPITEGSRESPIFTEHYNDIEVMFFGLLNFSSEEKDAGASMMYTIE